MVCHWSTFDSFPGEAPPGLRRVLIVEDNQLSCNSLCYLLGRLGHQVDVAGSGPKGSGSVCHGPTTWRSST